MRQRKKVVWNNQQTQSPHSLGQRAANLIAYTPPVSDQTIELHNTQAGILQTYSPLAGAQSGDLFRLLNDFAVAQKRSVTHCDPIHPYIVSKHFVWSQQILPKDTLAIYLEECRVEEQTKNGKLRVLRQKFLIGTSIYIIQDLARIERVQS